MPKRVARMGPRRRRRWLPTPVAIVLALGACALLLGCGDAGSADVKGTATQPEASTFLEVPHMDLTQPSVFETATFALG